MTNETEYQRGYREGAEKMREDAAVFLSRISDEISEYNKELGGRYKITTHCMAGLPITPQKEQTR